MKRISLSTAVVIFLALAVVNPVRADLVQVGSADFVPLYLAGLGNLLLPEFAGMAIDGEIASVGCLFGGSLGLAMNADLSIEDVGYALFFDTAGDGQLVVEGGASELVIDGSLSVFADDCEILPFVPISFSLDFYNPEVSAGTLYIGFVSTPYLNTDTNEIVLDTDWSKSAIYIADIELLWDLFGLEELAESLLQYGLYVLITDMLLDDGALATTGDGGSVHDLLENAMDGIYLQHLCGCVTVTPGTPTVRHLVANMAVYLLPVGLILGLKRRMKRS